MKPEEQPRQVEFVSVTVEPYAYGHPAGVYQELRVRVRVNSQEYECRRVFLPDYTCSALERLLDEAKYRLLKELKGKKS